MRISLNILRESQRYLPSFEFVPDSSARKPALDTSIVARNVGSEDEPIAIGWHPYFNLPSGDRELVRLNIPGSMLAEVDGYDNVFPTGKLVTDTAKVVNHVEFPCVERLFAFRLPPKSGRGDTTPFYRCERTPRDVTARKNTGWCPGCLYERKITPNCAYRTSVERLLGEIDERWCADLEGHPI